MGDNLFEQLQVLAHHVVRHIGHARDVPARPRQALDKASLDRIADIPHDDGHRLGRKLGRCDTFRPAGDQDIDVEPD
jgi:hypothetical protein